MPALHKFTMHEMAKWLGLLYPRRFATAHYIYKTKE